MPGKLILVTGLAGADRGSLIRGALEKFPRLSYLHTYTTRPKKTGEESSHEYIFMSAAEYASKRVKSKSWNHTEYAGHSYGVDISGTQKLLAKGTWVICSVLPDYDVIGIMKQMYEAETVTIWVKTPPDIAKSQIYEDDIKDVRNEDFALSTSCDLIFEPSGEVDADVEAFTDLLTNAAGVPATKS